MATHSLNKKLEGEIEDVVMNMGQSNDTFTQVLGELISLASLDQRRILYHGFIGQWMYYYAMTDTPPKGASITEDIEVDKLPF